jgi:monoterpene epsilon-lactone hydrolase
MLRDDTQRMADRLRASGGAVTIDMWPNTPHVWPIFRGWLPEADAAIAQAGRFVGAALDQAAVRTR